MLVRRFHRIVNIEQRTLTQDKTTKEFSPLLTKGQVVDCDFVGQGTVLDKRHFCVVWAADRKTEHIVVIPLTSKNRSGIAAPFSLGIIEGLDETGDEKDSIAKVNQPQSISRKSVHILTKKNAKGQKEPMRLSEAQLQKLNDIFRKYHLKEPALSDVLERSIGYMLPISPVSTFRHILDRPVQHVLQGDQLWCKSHEASAWTVIKLVKANGIMNNAQRKQFLIDLCSGDELKEQAVESALHELLEAKVAAASNEKN